VLRFTVLASGSGGNASVVESADFGLLIDAGLGPRQLSARLTEAGLSWSAINAVLLTHTHSDHWKDRTLAFLQRRHIPLWCHPEHHRYLKASSGGFNGLESAQLVRYFAANQELALAPGLRCRALPVRHDGGPTFGFRVEGPADLFGQATSLAYAADLGTWDDHLVESLANVDLLALEFNHDVVLEQTSGRSAMLVARVLGDEGHLSNVQAAALVRAVLARSRPGRLQHLVQLHLSGDCNDPALARQTAEGVLTELAPQAGIHTAQQDTAGATLHLNAEPTARRRVGPARRRSRSPAVVQPWLPWASLDEP
jgi:phosphoribosyl 1,2-cyclic phosphodiesterase